jgi:hypothetical protein
LYGRIILVSRGDILLKGFNMRKKIAYINLVILGVLLLSGLTLALSFMFALVYAVLIVISSFLISGLITIILHWSVTEIIKD